MSGIPYHHFSNPVIAGVDVTTVGIIAGYWSGIMHDYVAPAIGTVSLFLSACWYAYCLYEALRKKKRK